MNTSQLNPNQPYENASNRHVEAVIDDLKWVFRKTPEKDNDIDGEIEVFNEGYTTAKIIKVQLKSTLQVETKEKFAIFDCPVKFLNFCDVCDIPILLVHYCVTTKKAYWIWTQMYIFKELEINKPNWRNNRNKVRVKIPIENEFTQREEFKLQIQAIADKGINEIQQMRKMDTSDYYYTVLEEQDASSPNNRRIAAKVYIEKSFATSKEATIELIKKINEKVKSSLYHKKILTGTQHREVDVVWLYLYDDLIQYKAGAPFCRTEWINPDANNTFKSTISNEDVYLVQHQIKIRWETYYRPLQEYLTYNTTSKGEYLEKMRMTIAYIKKETMAIIDLFSKQDKKEFYKYANNKATEYRDIFINFGDSPYPPYECLELHEMIEESISTIDNMTDSITNMSVNDYYIESNYINYIKKNKEVLKYLIEKVMI
ncbi:DUF4365 domain-containing protein [Peribacillus butanolivorans]|uniref:DUF4365 domain-containing protein n=1 Tax=Peribacillus butanolivorans TaxID=421767 RepID=UPI00366CA3F5